MNWANKLHNDDLAKLLLRIAVGGLMLFHGVAKLQSGVDGIAPMLAKYSLPGWIAYGVYVGEVIAPVLILLGYYTRTAGFILAFNMVVAVGLAHANDIFALDPRGGGAAAMEVQLFYFLGGLALMFSGAGKYSLSRGAGPLD